MGDGGSSSTRCILFTDVVGSTKRWADDAAAMARDLEQHDDAIRFAIEANDGGVFATGGDGFACVFDTAARAVDAAIAVQRALGRVSWDGADPLLVRIGIHAGEVIARGGDYFGPTVNAAARLMSAAHGGQIVVSSAALPDGVDRRDLGEHRFRDVSEPMRVYQIVAGDLGTDFPPLASVDRSTSTLPTALSSFVGRAAEVDRVRTRLGEHRLVTITGVGGVGKTRLAIESAAAEQSTHPGGVYFADLTSVTEPAHIPTAIAEGMGVLAGPDPIADIVRFARERPTLLVLDNCEHQLDPVADVVYELLSGAPNLRILATSREALEVDGEGTFRVPSLDPATTGLRLFVERATAVDDAFELDDRTRPLIEQLCAELDGIPLAIELAATRTRSMSVADLLAGIEDRFSLLRGGRRGGGARRQRTLEATIGWSYELLDEDERAFFRRLGVFVGPFVSDVVATVTDCAPARARDLLDSLVSKSLIVATSDELTTYRLLETVRSYALDRLADHGETMATADRHETAYVQWQAQMSASVDRSIRIDGWSPEAIRSAEISRVAQDSNIAAAADRAITNGRLERAVELTCVTLTETTTGERRGVDLTLLRSLAERWDELDTSSRSALALRLATHFIEGFDWAEVARHHGLARRHRDDAPLLVRLAIDVQTAFLGSLTDPVRAVATIPQMHERWTGLGIVPRPLTLHLIASLALCRRYQDAYEALLADVRGPYGAGHLSVPHACQGLWLSHQLGLPPDARLVAETAEPHPTSHYSISPLVARAVAAAPTPLDAARGLLGVADQLTGRVPFEEAELLLGFARVAHLLGEEERALEILDCTVDRGPWSVWVAAETRAAITGHAPMVWNATELAAEVTEVPGELARRRDRGPRMVAEEIHRWRTRLG